MLTLARSVSSCILVKTLSKTSFQLLTILEVLFYLNHTSLDPFLFPNWQRNLTGVIAQDSLLQGALYWQVEAGMALLTHRDHEWLLGFSPLMVEYKFLNPKRKWAPTFLAGAGFSMTNWDDPADYELGTEFEFLIHAGGGIEVFCESGSYSFNYRLFHISNAGMKRPNIGLNSHVFSLGFRF